MVGKKEVVPKRGCGLCVVAVILVESSFERRVRSECRTKQARIDELLMKIKFFKICCTVTRDPLRFLESGSSLSLIERARRSPRECPLRRGILKEDEEFVTTKCKAAGGDCQD